jgi:hypothetical protein
MPFLDEDGLPFVETTRIDSIISINSFDSFDSSNLFYCDTCHELLEDLRLRSLFSLPTVRVIMPYMNLSVAILI